MQFAFLALGISLAVGGTIAYFFPDMWLGAPRPDIAMFGSLKEVEEEAKRVRKVAKDEGWKESERVEIRKGAKLMLAIGLAITMVSLFWWLGF